MGLIFAIPEHEYVTQVPSARRQNVQPTGWMYDSSLLTSNLNGQNMHKMSQQAILSIRYESYESCPHTKFVCMFANHPVSEICIGPH